jgi:hypothetical protein
MLAPRFWRFVDGLRRDMGDEDLDRYWRLGRGLGLDGAAELDLAWARGDGSRGPMDSASDLGDLHEESVGSKEIVG